MRNSPTKVPANATGIQGALAAAALALLLSSCAATRPAAVGSVDRFPNHTESEVRALLRTAISDTVTSLRAEAMLSIRSPYYSGTASARIMHRRGDSLLVSLYGTALRIEAGRLLVTTDSVFFYNRLQNQLYYGPSSALSQRLSTALLEGPVLERLLGVMVPHGPDMALRADSARAQYHLEDSTLHFIIVPGLWRTTSYTHKMPGGDLIEALAFTEFDAEAGVHFPRRIILRRPREGTNISLRYGELQLNPPSLSLSLDVAADVERLDMGMLTPRR